jgi:hypothetical protein
MQAVHAVAPAKTEQGKSQARVCDKSVCEIPFKEMEQGTPHIHSDHDKQLKQNKKC